MGAGAPLIPLVKVELHSLGFGVNAFSLVPLVSVELHLLGLGSRPPPLGLRPGSGLGLATVYINMVIR